ncbi:MAG: hypothetical protein BMS9Abin07_0114 [Acidimicrobiia bacterium]|nr:MAG: hypothetical protein BMS9Abin07_0114 [Acidimicrobiia bacterium]
MGVTKRVLLWVMGGFYVVAGMNHFLNAEAYIAIMPTYLPWHGQLVFLSGLGEVALGIGVLIPTTRVVSAWGIILLLILIFPANLYVAMNDLAYFGGEPNTLLNWLRLPFQLVLIAWAYGYTKPALPEPVVSPT